MPPFKIDAPVTVRSPVIVPPALGKAALAVVVVASKVEPSVATSLPSTVPETTRLPVRVAPVAEVSNFFELSKYKSTESLALNSALNSALTGEIFIGEPFPCTLNVLLLL